jgi:hypothetical protein
MAMPDVRHVVVHVQVAATVGVVKPDAFAADDVQRFFIEETIGRAQQLPSAGQQRVSA